MLTIELAVVMMAGLFLLLWGAVGFVQNNKFFASAPKEALDVIQPKEERFKGQHAVGWVMLILALLLMGGALVYGGYDGIKNGFGFWQFFARFAAMLLLLKVYDILFFDYYLLCRSGFFPHYYPEVKTVYGPHIFRLQQEIAHAPGRADDRGRADRGLGLHTNRIKRRTTPCNLMRWDG